MNVTIKNMIEGYQSLKHNQKTLIISSLLENGEPHISYAPYIEYKNNFYIYISRTAEHYHAISHSKVIELLIIKDEGQSQNAFARERIRLKATPRIVKEEGHEHIFDLFSNKHPKPLITMLRGLDFTLFQLSPTEGRYIVGFGQAFDINIVDNSLTHVVIDKKK